MNIDDMSDQDKSRLLMQLMGWEVKDEKKGHLWVEFDIYKFRLTPPLYLYDAAWVHFAWRILNWAQIERHEAKAQKEAGVQVWTISYSSRLGDVIGIDLDLFSLPLEEAIRLLLDEILRLAIDTGRIK